MTLVEVLKKINDYNQDAFIHVRRIDGNITLDSETVILDLNEEEMEWNTAKVTEYKCPGFDYFMEVYLIQEFLDEINAKEYPSFESKCKRLIHYAEFDA